MSQQSISVQDILKLLRQLDLHPAVGCEEIKKTAAEIWHDIASGPPASEAPRKTAEALRKVARAWQGVPTRARFGLSTRIGLYLERKGVTWGSDPFVLLPQLLDDLPRMLEDEGSWSSARVRRGTPGRPRERRVAQALLYAYLRLTRASLPGESDLSTVKTPYARLVEGTFELLGLDGWDYHGREAVRAAKGKVKKRRKRRE